MQHVVYHMLHTNTINLKLFLEICQCFIYFESIVFTNEDARLLLDLAKLANECRIGLGEDESISQKAIDALSEEYVADDLIIIYGYFIQHETNAKILLHL